MELCCNQGMSIREFNRFIRRWVVIVCSKFIDKRHSKDWFDEKNRAHRLNAVKRTEVHLFIFNCLLKHPHTHPYSSQSLFHHTAATLSTRFKVWNWIKRLKSECGHWFHTCVRESIWILTQIFRSFSAIQVSRLTPPFVRSFSNPNKSINQSFCLHSWVMSSFWFIQIIKYAEYQVFVKFSGYSPRQGFIINPQTRWNEANSLSLKILFFLLSAENTRNLSEMLSFFRIFLDVTHLNRLNLQHGLIC